MVSGEIVVYSKGRLWTQKELGVHTSFLRCIGKSVVRSTIFMCGDLLMIGSKVEFEYCVYHCVLVQHIFWKNCVPGCAIRTGFL